MAGRPLGAAQGKRIVEGIDKVLRGIISSNPAMTGYLAW